VALAPRIYARALFAAAKDEGRLAAVHGELGDFVGSLREVPELRDFVRNPQIDGRAKRRALDALLGEGDPLVRNAVLLLLDKGRGAEIESVYEELERLVAREEGRLDVDLTTAYEVSDEQARAIVSQIEEASGRRVQVTRSVDADLIGGIILRAGSLRVDASVRGRLERLRHELVTRA